MYSLVFNLKRELNLLLIAILALLPELTLAQGCCCGGAGGMGTSIARFGMDTPNPKSLQLLLAYDLNNMNSLYDNAIRIEDNDNQRVIHSAIFVANYGISRKLSVGAIMSYMGQELGSKSIDGRRQVDYLFGFGDLILMAKFRLTNPLAYNGWGIYAGIGPKLPTGSSSKISSEGSIYPTDIQTGTGSLDAVTWLSINKSHIFITNLYLNTGATFRLSGQNRHYRDSLVYRPGNEFQYTAGLSYNFYKGLIFDIFNYVQYRYQSIDKLSGEPVDKTGGHWVFTSPGIRIYFTQNLSFVVTTDIPLYHYLNGPQLSSSFRFSAALTYTFTSKKAIELEPGL
jgi:hypothetical protein